MEVEHILRDSPRPWRRGSRDRGSLVALTVVATLLLQATTAGYVARRLDLIEDPEPETTG